MQREELAYGHMSFASRDPVFVELGPLAHTCPVGAWLAALIDERARISAPIWSSWLIDMVLKAARPAGGGICGDGPFRGLTR